MNKCSVDNTPLDQAKVRPFSRFGDNGEIFEISEDLEKLALGLDANQEVMGVYQTCILYV